MAGKLRVLERGTDMVLAEHYTGVHGGKLTAVTLKRSAPTRRTGSASGWSEVPCRT